MWTIDRSIVRIPDFLSVPVSSRIPNHSDRLKDPTSGDARDRENRKAKVIPERDLFECQKCAREGP